MPLPRPGVEEKSKGLGGPEICRRCISRGVEMSRDDSFEVPLADQIHPFPHSSRYLRSTHELILTSERESYTQAHFALQHTKSQGIMVSTAQPEAIFLGLPGVVLQAWHKELGRLCVIARPKPKGHGIPEDRYIKAGKGTFVKTRIWVTGEQMSLLETASKLLAFLR